MKILVCDDEALIRNVIKEYLLLENYEVFEAENGIDAIDVIKNNDIDLVIMDIMMPKMDGYQAVREIKKIKGFKVYLLDIKTDIGSGINTARKIREEYDDWVSMIIMISGYAEYKYEALGKRLMLVDFINKIEHPERKLQDALLICMKNYDNKYKALRYKYKNTAYNIEFRSIVKIEREQGSKRCIIYTDEGKLLGKVDDIYNTGSNDIYVVKDELGKQILLPGIKEVIKEVKLDEKIIVHLIQGLV